MLFPWPPLNIVFDIAVKVQHFTCQLKLELYLNCVFKQNPALLYIIIIMTS